MLLTLALLFGFASCGTPVPDDPSTNGSDPAAMSDPASNGQREPEWSDSEPSRPASSEQPDESPVPDPVSGTDPEPSDGPSEGTSSPAHEHVYEKQVFPPDCTHDGTVRYVCACGDAYEEKGEPALGHDDRKTVVSEPGCEEEGMCRVTCSRCGESRLERVEPLGHRFTDRTTDLADIEGGYRLTDVASCTRCGKKDMTVRDLTITGALSLNAADRAADVPGEGGIVSATLASGGNLMLRAKAKSYYTFLGWSDGVQTAERDYAGTESLTALFACQTDKMPVLRIHTENETQITHRDYYLKCQVTLSECDTAYALKDAEANIRVRGNASSNYGDPEYAKTHKVHYRLKFETKTGMLGLNGGAKCKSWVLLRGDTNFLREPVSFKLFTDITQGKYYASDYTFVQLYVNDEYYGAYVLCEQTQIQKNRIAISEKKDADTELKTGYLVEIDNYAAHETYHWGTDFGGMTLTDPYGVSKPIARHGYSVKYDQMTSEQLKYVRKYIEHVYLIIYRAIYENTFYTLDSNMNLVRDAKSATAEECISRVFDLDAAVAMYITREVAAERDGGCGSFFMYVDFQSEQPKLTFAAPWDFSWAYATDHGFAIDHLWVGAFQPEEFAYAGDRSFTWFITLYKADFFKQMVKETWADMRKRKVQEGILNEIQRVKTTYKKDFQQNNTRWKSGDQGKSADKLYSFLKERMAWLDREWALG